MCSPEDDPDPVDPIRRRGVLRLVKPRPSPPLDSPLPPRPPRWGEERRSQPRPGSLPLAGRPRAGLPRAELPRAEPPRLRRRTADLGLAGARSAEMRRVKGLPREKRGARPEADPPDDRMRLPARRQEAGRPPNEEGLGEDGRPSGERPSGERPSGDERLSGDERPKSGRPSQDDPRGGRPRKADRPGVDGRVTLVGMPSAEGERLKTDPPRSDRPIRVLPKRELRIRGLPPREPPSREPPKTPPDDRELKRTCAGLPRALATPAPWPAKAAPSALPPRVPPRPSRRFGSRLGLGL